jgi:peptide/nickel transport system substrate-binding protein
LRTKTPTAVASRAAVRLLGLGLLGLLLACRNDAPPPNGLLTLAVRADVSGFFPNPPVTNESYTIHVNRNVLEGLVGIDGRLKLQPALAERWENPDDRTYLFDLRPDLRFSDGRPVTAGDVAASLNAARTRRFITRDYLQAVESVRAIGEHRVEIKTRGPYLILLSKLPFGFVLPAESLAETPVPVVGTGPYRLEAWTPGRELRLARNPYYRGPPAAFAQARFVVVPDVEERVARVRRGEAQIADDVPLERIESLAALPDVRVVRRSSLRVLFLCLRVDRTPFSDPRVREAVDLAIDRQELIVHALAGQTEPASQLVTAAVVGFNPRLTITRPDRVRARQLLKEAGYARGLELRLDGTRNRYVNDEQILHEVARQLGEVGMQISVNALDKREFYSLSGGGGSLFHLLGWSCESVDAGDALDSLVHSPVEGMLGSFNSMGLSDPELDRLIDEANRATTIRERARGLQIAIARVAELRPLIPLVIQTEAVLISRRIRWDPPPNLPFDLLQIRPEP